MHRYIYIQDDQCKRRNGAPSSVCSQLHKTTSRGQIPPSPLAIILDHPPTDRGQTRRRNRVACASSIDIIYQRLPKIFKTSNADCRRVPENHLCLLRMMQYLHVLSLYTYVRSGAWGMIYSHITQKKSLWKFWILGSKVQQPRAETP